MNSLDTFIDKPDTRYCEGCSKTKQRFCNNFTITFKTLAYNLQNVWLKWGLVLHIPYQGCVCIISQFNFSFLHQWLQYDAKCSSLIDKLINVYFKESHTKCDFNSNISDPKSWNEVLKMWINVWITGSEILQLLLNKCAWSIWQQVKCHLSWNKKNFFCHANCTLC